MRRFILAIPVAAVLFVGLSDSVGQSQPPTKPKSRATDKAPASSVVFEMYKDSSGEHWRYRMKDGDKILAIAPKGFDSKEECKKVIEAIQKEAARAKITEEK